jgi:branched-subunit amino acid aminotransferase/4-amino-4-deoxychorismate lyase
MGRFVLLDGKIVRREAARIPVDDLAVIHGWGLFETSRAYRGVTFRLEDHLRRLQRSMSLLHMKSISLSARALHRSIGALLRREKSPDDTAVRLTVTHGPDWGSPHWFVQTRPIAPPSGSVRLMFAPWPRSTQHPLYGHKTLNYLENALARDRARRNKVFETLFQSTEGHVLECSASNVFLVRGSTLVTPALGERILPGITRMIVLKIAKSLKLPVSEEIVRARDLYSADQVFITNSLIELVSVSHLDGRHVPERRTDIVGALQARYRSEVIRYTQARLTDRTV